MECDDSRDGAGLRRWLPYAVIAVASAIAHLWCLKSQFYMDDMPGIRDNLIVRSGALWEVEPLNLWTMGCYMLQYRLFGMSSAGFHAVNWLLHTAVACVLFGFGRDLLRGRMPAGVAWFAALLFAVHPLASEIPNYARTQDLAWVTLFSLFASWSMLAWTRGGGWKFLVGVVLAWAAAAMSKGPGLFHAGMMVTAVGLATMDPGRAAWWKQRWQWVGGAALAAIAVLWMSGVLARFWAATELWKEPRFLGHGLTVSRVFWEFAWRAVIPVSLCSDHQISETVVSVKDGRWVVQDPVAIRAAVGMLVLTFISLGLAWFRSTRIFGVCLFLFTATMLFRVLYLIPEFMPEYRIYPGLPWFCLGAAILAAAVWKRIPGGGSPAWLAALVLAGLAVLSAKRSFVWHDLDRLCADVLKQYPAQARAVWELHDRDAARGDWQALIRRHQTVWPGVFNRFIEQSKALAPGRNLNSGHFALADVACHGRYAIARAHVQGPRAGVMEINQLQAKMKALGITPENNRTICGYFHHARAVVMEMAGAYPQALESMRFAGVAKITADDIRRVERKMAESKR